MKKRSDGRYKRTFTFNGRQYSVYGYNKQELDIKEHEKRLELEDRKEIHDNPTLNQYHEQWTDARRGTVKDSTLRCQYFQYESCAKVKLSNGLRLGDMKLKEINPDDIREVQRALSDGNTSQTVNDKVAVLSHIFNTAVKERRLDL